MNSLNEKNHLRMQAVAVIIGCFLNLEVSQADSKDVFSDIHVPEILYGF